MNNYTDLYLKLYIILVFTITSDVETLCSKENWMMDSPLGRAQLVYLGAFWMMKC